jgi:outer membrane autotransporter protein
MKREPAYRQHLRRIEIGVAKPFMTLASVAIASPPASWKSALRLGLTFGAVGVLGLSAPPATGQGELNDFSTQSDAQRPMAQAINEMCPALQEVDPGNGLLPVCGNLVFNEGDPAAPGFQLPQEELNSAVQTLNGEELQAIQQQVGDVRANQMTLIAGQLDAIRKHQVGPGIRFVGLDPDRKVLAAGYREDLLMAQGNGLGAPIWDRLGVFATAGGQFGDKSTTGEVVGYDFWGTGLTVGADYRLRDDLVLGAAVGYSYYDVEFDEDADNPSDQELDSNSVTLSLFGTHFFEQGLFLDGIASFGWSSYDTQRHVVVPSNNAAVDPVDAQANGDTDAVSFGVASNFGYDLALGGFTITPVVRAQYAYAEVADYTESGASPVNLEFGDQEADSFTTNLGAEVGYAFSTAYGVIRPSVRGEYIHEYLNDNNGVRLQYENDQTGLSAFEVITEDPDRNYGLLGASVTGTLAAGWSAFADFETIVGLSNFDIYTFRAGFRKEF